MMKKLSVGAWITCLAVLAAIVAIVLYTSNIGAEGYFKGAEVSNLMLFGILAVAALIAAVILKQVAPASKAADVLSGLLQIAAPVLLTLAAINLIAARVEGLGFIYFSNADVAKEVQTPANLSSASGAIAGMVAFGVAMLIAIVGAFCSLRRKDA